VELRLGEREEKKVVKYGRTWGHWEAPGDAREEISIECAVLGIPGRVILHRVRKLQKTHAICRDKPHNMVVVLLLLLLLLFW
jgi:hypothetical protein